MKEQMTGSSEATEEEPQAAQEEPPKHQLSINIDAYHTDSTRGNEEIRVNKDIQSLGVQQSYTLEKEPEFKTLELVSLQWNPSKPRKQKQPSEEQGPVDFTKILRSTPD